MKTITITIPLDGPVKIEANGFTGCGCDVASKAFEDALGTVQERKTKAERYQGETVKQSQKAGTK